MRVVDRIRLYFAIRYLRKKLVTAKSDLKQYMTQSDIEDLIWSRMTGKEQDEFLKNHRRIIDKYLPLIMT